MYQYLIEKLLDLAKQYQTSNEKRLIIEDLAIAALLKALNETQLYYTDIESGMEKNRDSEKKLVALWSEAAIPLRKVDPNFAEICQTKSEYWLNPSEWKPEEIHNNGIGLRDVAEKYKNLLNPNKRSLL